MPGFIGFWELVALAVVLLLLFGPKRLPEVGRSMGKGIREFKDSLRTMTEPAPEEEHEAALQTTVADADPASPPSPSPSPAAMSRGPRKRAAHLGSKRSRP